jgi:hypothetical protein
MHNEHLTQPASASASSHSPDPFTLETSDGFPIKGVCRRDSGTDFPARPVVIINPFTAVTAPILAVGIMDDEFGTVPALERLLAYFDRSPRIHLRISPQSIQEPQIGHFGFFNSRFEHKLWPLPLEWLTAGRIPAAFSTIQTHFAPESILAVSPT